MNNQDYDLKEIERVLESIDWSELETETIQVIMNFGAERDEL